MSVSSNMIEGHGIEKKAMSEVLRSWINVKWLGGNSNQEGRRQSSQMPCGRYAKIEERDCESY